MPLKDKDSLVGTVSVAALLCVVCSFVVSFAAVSLRSKQDENKLLDQQKNILDATGLSTGEYGRTTKNLKRDQIDSLGEWISAKLVDLETGEFKEATEEEIAEYDAKEAAGKDELRIEIADQDPKFDPGEKYREKVAKVYFVKKPGEDRVRQVVLPVYGKGLWSTLRGYLALKSDLKTIQGLTFYEHGETPGLGGEVDNPAWKAQWEGMQLFDAAGAPAVQVYKGPAPNSAKDGVDGLSGATITSRGVTNLLRYWASEDGYGPFLAKMETELKQESGDN